MKRLRGLVADTRPLRVATFRRLWIANIITVIGAQLTIVSVPAQIYAITENSAYVGLTGVFGLVPLIIFGLYGGALADVFDRRALLIISTLGLIGTSVLFFVQALLGLNNVWLLLVIFAVQQGFFGINQPARSAVLPRILPGEFLPAANSLSTVVFQAGAIAGPLVGGALIPVLGFTWLYLIDAITLLATLWAVVKLPAVPPERTPERRAGLRSVWEGLRYLSGHPIVLMSFLVDVIAMLFGMPRALFPQIAHQSFGGPAEGGTAFALLFAAIPAGAVLGGVFSGWVSRVERQGLAVIISITVWGLAIVAFGVAVGFAAHGPTTMLIIALIALAVAGAADMASSSFRMTMLQQATTDEVRGRLQGTFLVVVAGGPRIADVVHGSVAAMAGAAVTSAGGGALVVVALVIACVAVPSFVRYRVARAAVVS